MRNFHRGYKNDSSNFSRGDRRPVRDSRYGNDDYKRPDKTFNRSFQDRNTKPRRDFDNDQPRSSFSHQERRDNRSERGVNRSFHERNFRSEKPDRYRNQTPPRSRDRSSHSDSRFTRTNDTRARQRSPPAPPSFPSRSDFQAPSSRPRTSRGGISSRPPRGMGNPSRILRRPDLRSSLIMKRSAPTSRSKEYIKKIKQARLKLSESSQKSKTGDGDQEEGDEDEPKTPPKETETEDKPSEHDEDFLDVANDVNFEEDEEWDAAKNSSAKSEESSKTKAKNDDEKDTEAAGSLNASGTTNSDERPARRERSASHRDDPDWASSIDLSCVHCGTKCASVQDFRFHLTRRSHTMAMKKVSVRLRLTLNRLRKVQRDRQLDIEARLKNVENIPSKYCQICKLYFRQSKIEHRDSDDHKKIRNFLKPFCKICHVQLLSAMKFEVHKCTINHLKQKLLKNDSPDDDDDFSVNELDLGHFKTVDSVGDVDGEEVESAMEEDEDLETTEAGGQEFVNKIEVNYCSLCREYLTRSSNDAKIITEHCKTKKHLKWYNQSKKKEENPKPAAETAESSNNATSSDKSLKNEEKDEKSEDEEASASKSEPNNDDDSTKFPRYYEQLNG